MTRSRQAPGPPYVSFNVFIDNMDWLESVGLPQRFDQSVWDKRHRGTGGVQMNTAFVFMGLVDTNAAPTDVLQRLVFNPSRRASILAQLLRTQYSSVFALDLTNATRAQIEEQFRRWSLSGTTLRKAVTFFVHAATYAGLPLSPHLTRRLKGQRRKPAATEIVTRQSDEAQGARHPSLVPLLDQLATEGPVWGEPEKQRWLKAWVAVLDLVYPARAT